MTTVTKTDLVDHKGSIDGDTSYNVPPDNGRCATLYVPSGPSSLAEINVVGGLGDCNAFQAPPSGKCPHHCSNYCYVSYSLQG